ncbi:MAG: MMPL family transporter [Stenotrophobium sp.]
MASNRLLRLRFFVWLALMLVLCTVFFTRVVHQLNPETDILALLPGAEQDPVVGTALHKFSDQAGRKTLFLIGADTADAANHAADEFAASLRGNAAFSDVQLEVQNRLRDTLAAYQPYRGVLLAAGDRDKLAAHQDNAIYDAALRALYTPAGLMRPLSPAQDPLGLSSDFLLQQVPPLGKVQLDNGRLTVNGQGRHWVLVIAETRDSPFSSAAQEQAMPVVEQAYARAHAAGAEVLSSGLLPHAAYAAQRAKLEISVFGGISLLGTILLLLFVHRSMRPVMMSAASIGLGLIAALTVSHYVFGRIHLITLVFGSSLIGVAADYSTYFLTDAFRVPGRWDGRDAVRHVAPGILLGLATALVAYAILMCAPFPGLRQIAVFSAVGLSTACGCVLCLFPLLRPPQAPPVSPMIERGLRALLPRPLGKAGLLILAVIVVVAVSGMLRLRVVNDLRLMQASPPQLMQSEKRVRELMNNPTETQFFLVTGDTPEAVLEHEEILRPKLDALQTSGVISSYAALTRALPSLKTQDENAALMQQQVCVDGGPLSRILAQMGFASDAIATRLHDCVMQTSARLQPQQWLDSPAAASYRHLWLGPVPDGYGAVLTLGGIRDLAPLKALDAPGAGVRFVDKVSDISALLARYQRITTWIVALGHLAVLVLFTLRYGFSSALRVVASPALACLGTLGLFGLFGEPVNLFGTFALLLVLGIGIDYAIFLREGRNTPLSSLIAVLVCAATTLLSFGLLAFSSTPFIHSFGLTLLLGISLAVVIAQTLAIPAHFTNLNKDKNNP